MNVNGYKPGSAVTNIEHMANALEDQKLANSRVNQARFNKDTFQRGPGRGAHFHNDFAEQFGSRQQPNAALQQADELVEAANKKTLSTARKGSSLLHKISTAMRKFKFGKALKKLLRKIPGLARFIGAPIAVISYIADSSTAHAAIIPYWVNRFNTLKNRFKTSSNPLEQLECLRKMCAIIYTKHRPVEQSFDASLLAARVVYQEEPGKRDKLIAHMLDIFGDYRQAAGAVGYIMQDLCNAATPLINAVHRAYGHQSEYASRLKDYRTYFQTFQNASNGYVRISAQLVPTPSMVAAELAVPMSGLSFR